MKKFIHNEITLGWPEGWLDTSILLLNGPPINGFSPNITVTRERIEHKMNSQEYAAIQLNALKESLGEDGYRVLEEKKAEYRGMKAYQRVHTFQISDAGVAVKQLQVYFVNESEALTITCTDSVEHFEQSQKLFFDAIMMFTWHAKEEQPNHHEEEETIM